MVVDVQNKTTPVRVVFNSSQNCGGMSLNKSLEIGPEVMQLAFFSDLERIRLPQWATLKKCFMASESLKKTSLCNCGVGSLVMSRK